MGDSRGGVDATPVGLTGDRSSDPPVVFFDGYCHLCDRFVTFLMRLDRREVLRFAPLQGETAASVPAVSEVLAGESDDPRTVVLLIDGRIHTESSAAIRALSALGGVYRTAAALLVIPPPLRNAVYRWVARHRHRFFGRRDSCRLPTPRERNRFLP